MKITDIHAHVFPDAIARKAAESIGEFYHMPTAHDGTVGHLLQKHMEAGIGHACIHSVAITPHSVDSINRFISESVKQHPDRLTGFGAIHPGREDLYGLAEEVKALGLKGLRFIRTCSNLPLTVRKQWRCSRQLKGNCRLSSILVLTVTGIPVPGR